jgi:hypothetical protein
MKSKKKTTETFEVAAADIKKLVDHLDVLSKDFSDTIVKLKAVTESHVTDANVTSSEENNEQAEFSNKAKPAKSEKNVKKAKANVDEEEEEKERTDDNEEVETFVSRHVKKPARREGFVNGVAGKMAGNYMLLD